MVINAYEIRKRTVSNGSHPRFFAGAGGAITLTFSNVVLPNKVVKWHP
jgi:hypothetical protein